MEFQLSCPIPKSEYDKVLLAHGGGGTLTHQLISKTFPKSIWKRILKSIARWSNT